MPWDADLTPEQRAIASDEVSPVRLVAGPGTGKTRVLTRRIAYLIEEGEVDPSSILAVTFSRAAARELRDRLHDLLGAERAKRVAVYTLHGFALRQLLRNRGAPNLPRPIRIADDYDERHVIQEELRLITSARRIVEIRDELRNLASDWETLAADNENWDRLHANRRFLGAWRRHREIYGYTLRAELVYAVKKALEQDPEFELERDFEHVVVDEYQDLNRCEIEVVRQLAALGPHLFGAGDDDQSIYAFRNAFPLGLREYGQTHPGAAERELEICHRCDRDILNLGIAVAEQDVDRIPKALRPRDEAGQGEVTVYRFRNISDEAAGIARVCGDLVDGGLRPSEILILLRNNPQRVYSDPIVAALEEVGIRAELPQDPFAIFNEDGPRQLVCILRLLRDREDGLAWREILELRPNRVGAATLLEVYALADERGERYAATLATIRDVPDLLGSRMRRRLADDIAEVDELLDRLEGALDEPIVSELDRLLQEAELDPAADEALGEARALLMDLIPAEEEPTLGDAETAVQTARGSYDEAESEWPEDRVRIMSMHSAKGLTSPAVIVAACEDELIPGTFQERRDLDDQRRLLYVSLTRAEHFLIVTYAARRAGRQSTILQAPEARTLTRFLRDLVQPRELAQPSPTSSTKAKP